MSDAITEMGEPGEIWRLSKTVMRVLAPNPGLMTGPGTNTYVVGGPEAAIVLDPGPAIESHKAAVLDAIGGREVRSILVTHHHIDHWPLAPELGEELDAIVYSHGPIGDFAPDRRMPAGGVQVVPGARLRALHTPGHASDHLCFVFEEEDALFSGDHILADTTTVIAPPDGNMASYMESLEITKKLDVSLVYPGHGPVIADAGAWIDYYISHRVEREQAVIEAVFAGVETIPEMVERIYTDVDDALHPIARFSVLAHLEKLIAEGKVSAPEEDLAADRDFASEAGNAESPAIPLVEPPLMESRFRPVTGA